MKLRSGDKMSPSTSRYKQFKTRINTVYSFNQVRPHQIEFIRNKLNSWNNMIGGDNVDDLLISIMEVPELAAYSFNFRNMLKLRTGQIINHKYYRRIIKPDVYRAFKSYFKWLKMRYDYNMF